MWIYEETKNSSVMQINVSMGNTHTHKHKTKSIDFGVMEPEQFATFL